MSDDVQLSHRYLSDEQFDQLMQRLAIDDLQAEYDNAVALLNDALFAMEQSSERACIDTAERIRRYLKTI